MGIDLILHRGFNLEMKDIKITEKRAEDKPRR
jgi:hypothetical protein